MSPQAPRLAVEVLPALLAVLVLLAERPLRRVQG